MVTTEIDTATRLRIALGKLSRALRKTDTASGLTPSRASALLSVDRHGPLRLSELAETEGVNPTMLSRMVADLVDAGLFERTSDPSDRRAAWVGVTPAGADLAARTRLARTEAVDAALSELAPRDAERIIAAVPALESLAAALKAGAR